MMGTMERFGERPELLQHGVSDGTRFGRSCRECRYCVPFGKRDGCRHPARQMRFPFARAPT